METALKISKSLFYLCLSIAIVTLTIKAHSYQLPSPPQPKPHKELPILNMKWHYDYSSGINTSSESYPIVFIRSGYKIIKYNSSTATYGVKYDLVNLLKNRITVDVSFILEDIDGFTIAEKTIQDFAYERDFCTIKGTISVPTHEANRVSNLSWRITYKPQQKLAKGKKRLEELSAVTKDNLPWDIQSYLTYLTENKYYISEKWKSILKENTKHIFPIDKSVVEKAGIDTASIPPWTSLVATEKFKALTDEEKLDIKHWLHRQERFASYSPLEGYYFDIGSILDPNKY